MHLLWQDLRYGVRLFGKAPGFTVVALLALALGLAATTAIFSVVDAVLIKPLPFRDPKGLLVIWEKNPAQNKYKFFVAPANFLAWQNQSRTTEPMAAFQDVHVNLTGGPNGQIQPEELKCSRVTATLFPLLGVQPVLGRVFRPDEDVPGHANFAVLGYSFWQRRFAADPAIAGKVIRLRDQPYTVTGVLPPDFALFEPAVDVWIPLGLNPGDTRISSGRFLTVIARRREALDRVRVELDTIGGQMEQAMPALDKGWRPSLFVLEDELVGGVKRALWVLLAAVGCLLLMACVNVANLLLARGATRRREIALRFALGAGRARILTQLLSESVLLSLCGGCIGLLLAAGVVRVLAHAGPAGIPRLAAATIDFRLFLFALAVSVITGILFGVAPALVGSSGDPGAELNEGGRGGTLGRRGRAVRNALVVSEVAIAVVVLIAAGLLIRSFIRLRSIDPGFQASGVLTMRVPLAGGRNAAPDRRVAFFQQLSERLAGLPGVRSVGAVNGLPLTGLGLGANFMVEGRPAPSAEQRPTALVRSVTPSYFRTMAIPLVAGRFFEASDTRQASPVVVVNQTLARRFWPGASAIGGRLVIDDSNTIRAAEIVGVVGDVKPDRVENEEWPTIYNPYAQVPVTSTTLVVRTGRAPMALASAVQREVHSLDPLQPVSEVRSMEDVVYEAASGARFNTGLLAVFAVVAFVLAAVGIYGVVSYDVNERTNDIGIRMALGAQPRDILGMILGQGARMAAYGIALGLLTAFAVTRLMSSMLFSVDPTDAWTFAAIAVLLAAVALAASYLPSRRAMALNPVAALRHH